uniref:Uncharacterized protein n=1 Tax=Fundulus heteroclitus TaxID=8078 RepID=A0A3Q2Q1J1_FUNHE
MFLWRRDAACRSAAGGSPSPLLVDSFSSPSRLLLPPQVLPIWGLAVPLPAVMMITISLYMVLLGVGLWIRSCLKVGPAGPMKHLVFRRWTCPGSDPFQTSDGGPVQVLTRSRPQTCINMDCACTCQPPDCQSCNCLCFEIRIK